VSKGVLTPEEAKRLVAFDAEGPAEEPDQVAELLKRVADLEAEIEEMKKDDSPAFTTESLEGLWKTNTNGTANDNWDEFWNGNEM
jgi:hypothetical protein